ncbi:protein kinase C-like [Xenopus tropicalis]|uniref:non-specific serine/threonine protein kinase n=1 Tax=Xenopus tropicalis TaxID=8364 RepID=A0A8J1JHJ2_XENTR|nr:protein kinase C-like [Xenopus tropicalis]
MGCKLCRVENSIIPTKHENAYVEILEISDVRDSLVEFTATLELPDHPAQPSFLESPRPAGNEEDPGSSHNIGGAIPFHEPEGSVPAETMTRDTASPTNFIWPSFDATVEVPGIENISEALVVISMRANSYEPPALAVFSDPDCDAGMSNNNGLIVPNQKQESEPEKDTEDDNSTSSSPSLPLCSPDFGSDSANNIQGAEGPSISPVEPRSPSLGNFNLGPVLGEGAFGKVFLAEHKNTKELCAIKALKKEEILKRGNLDSVFKEKEILQRVSSAEHPFLVSMHGTFQTESHLFCVMEYLPGGDMYEIVTSVELQEPDVM